ncbi:MAG: hypothetical protein AAGI07_09370 [Bacteroidota bacterium]
MEKDFDFNPAIITNTVKNTLVYFIPPIAPDSLSFTEVTSNSVVRNWQDNSDDETNFVVERSTDKCIYKQHFVYHSC